MLCGLQPTSSHNHHNLFRGFRGPRSLRHHKNNTSQSVAGGEEDMQRHHQHLPSDASSLARPSIDSTSSRRTDLSIDWDPLRLHPSFAPGPSPPLQDAFSESASRPYQPHELRHARASRPPRQLPSSLSPSQLHDRSPSSDTVIYDGFDFGFSSSSGGSSSNNNNTISTSSNNHHPTAALANFVTNANTPTSGRRRAPSLTPSEASSECSLTFSGSSAASSSLSDEEMGDGLGLSLGLTPAPAPRPRPRPRACGTGSSEDADYFIRRGEWKRRGIVFVDSGPPLAGEDETFEI
ncbi:hypothetical protein VTI28DRAFT_951 [Corynascus sepedonium]